MRSLKRGISLFTTSTPGEYFLGTASRAIRIYTSEQKVIAEHLALGVDENEISGVTGVSPIAVHNLMSELAHESLIDESQGRITLGDRFISKLDNRAMKNSKRNYDGAYIQLQNRIAPELEQSTWINRVTDGGVSVLNTRQSYLVEISASNRVGTLLYTLLITSGFTQVRFAARSRNSAIDDLDIGIDGITSSSIGLSFTKNREDLRRDYSLFPLDKSAQYLDEASTPDLVIACGDIDPEKLALWMSYAQVFMHIPHPRGGRAGIGPIVIPGKTPCLRCAELAEQDQSGVISHRALGVSEKLEYPQIAAHAIAAFAASQIVAYFDAITLSEGEALKGSRQCGKITVVDYQSLAQTQVVAITRHPLCGCAF